MKNTTVLIGTIQTTSSGHTQDRTREVEFEAEELGKLTDLGTGRDGGLTDTRGTTETLYKAGDDRLVVHIKDWSHWQGEPIIYSLHEVTEGDLAGSGKFARLGHEAGYGQPLTLDEALAMAGDTELDGLPSDAERLAGGEAVPCALCLRVVQPGEGYYTTTEGAVICMDCSESED